MVVRFDAWMCGNFLFGNWVAEVEEIVFG